MSDYFSILVFFSCSLYNYFDDIRMIVIRKVAIGIEFSQAPLTMLYRSTDANVVVALPRRTWPIAPPGVHANRLHHQAPELKT
jgi:hypothetical protein